MTDRTVQLVGGPLDGMTFPHPDPAAPDPGAYMIVPGELARAVYEPTEGDDPDRWHFGGWVGGEPGVPEGDDLEALIDELGPTVPPPDAEELLDALAEIAREQGRGEVL
ncbi:hypothetical protein AB0K60_19550 [Thermopolyspora sp. NPDC052614]|uniref:hypothetical protein n=1 Tax=Thermopolyspora sp. NPDC052614 TaxID=3155682 RepID=UPI003423CE2D